MIFIVFTAVFGTCAVTPSKSVPWTIPPVPRAKVPLPHRVRYRLFTDQGYIDRGYTNGRSKGERSDPSWEVVRLPVREGWTPRRMARWIKIQGYRDLLADAPHDVSVWVDSNVHLTPRFVEGCLLPLTRMTFDRPDARGVCAHEGVALVSLKHPSRNCTYMEIEYCFKRGMGADLTAFREQRRILKRMGFPEKWGLAETRIVVRTPALRPAFDAAWWSLFKQFHDRDQCSFMVAAWSVRPMAFRLLDQTRLEGPDGWFTLHRVRKHRTEGVSGALAGYTRGKRTVDYGSAMQVPTPQVPSLHSVPRFMPLYPEALAARTTPTAPRALRQDRF